MAENNSISRDGKTGRRIYNTRERSWIQRYGCYLGLVRREFRTQLGDMLEDAPFLNRAQLSPVMSYIQKSLKNMKQMYHPVIGIPVSLTPENFDLFPRLPLELQLMIWREALPGPRILELDWSPLSLKRPSSAKSSQRLVSNIALACKNADEVVNKRYQKQGFHILGGIYFRPEDDSSPCDWRPKYFVDLRNDVLYYPDGLWGFAGSLQSSLEAQGNEAPTPLYENVALSINALNEHVMSGRAAYTAEQLIPRVLRQLNSLKTLIFVGDGEYCLQGGIINRHYADADDIVSPFQATDFKDLPVDHAYLSVWAKAIKKIEEGLALPEVVEALKIVEVKFQLYRRPVTP